MKALLLIPKQYTLARTIESGFRKLGFTTVLFDFRERLNPRWMKWNTQMFRFPFKIRNRWETLIFPKINKMHLEVFEQEKPDIVFIYNSEMLLPETVNYFKQKAKILFILGDNPYYTPLNDYYLHLLFQGDLIISTDSFWAEQLKLLGIKNIVVDFPGYDEEPYRNIVVSEYDKMKYNFDILFVGTGYPNAWGYKRALFLNHFTEFNLKVYGGRHFIKWFKFFPDLEKKFELRNGHIPIEELVKMHKCAKLYPVDANPAILNGVHLRVFDCIAMGVLPIVEYRKDYDKFFYGIDIPLIKSYDEAEKIAIKYIENDYLRKNTLSALRAFLNENYKHEKALNRIIAHVF